MSNFEKLEVWNRAIDFAEQYLSTYQTAEGLGKMLSGLRSSLLSK
jgi:hypothetical protein